MKECIMTILLVLVLEFALMAQSDGFFMHKRYDYIVADDEYEIILLPKQHGLDYNYYADKAPLGSGCLLLLGMGLIYAKFKHKIET